VNAYLAVGVGAVALTLGFATATLASEAARKTEKPHGAEEIRKDIADHRAMAEAHLNAAKCFEAGKSEKECHGQLAKDCKGLGIGKYCGMKHRH
jgi:hypothetical protein